MKKFATAQVLIAASAVSAIGLSAACSASVHDAGSEHSSPKPSPRPHTTTSSSSTTGRPTPGTGTVVSSPTHTPTHAKTGTPTHAGAGSPAPASNGGDSLGSNNAIIKAVEHADHPGLSLCDGKYSVERIARSTIAPGAIYAAVMTTCDGATGGSPADVTIVEPYGASPQVVYSVATGTETYHGYHLLADAITSFAGNKLTVVYSGYGPNDAPDSITHWFKQTSTIYTPRAVKGGYTATSEPN